MFSISEMLHAGCLPCPDTSFLCLRTSPIDLRVRPFRCSAPCYAPAPSDDADRRRQCKEKRQAVTRKPSGLAFDADNGGDSIGI
jgi:hypothetical protein